MTKGFIDSLLRALVIVVMMVGLIYAGFISTPSPSETALLTTPDSTGLPITPGLPSATSNPNPDSYIDHRSGSDLPPTGPNPDSMSSGPELERAPTLMTSPDYGVQVFLFWRDEVADRDLTLVEDAGFRWVKQEFAWREIEGNGLGAYDWTDSDRLMDQVDAHGLNIIARVGVQPEWAGGNYPEIGPPDDYQDFTNFLIALTTRYKGRIDAYQIWNEPNLSREWGGRRPDPEAYTRMLKAAYQAIKSVDPAAYVISAGLAPTSRWDQVAMPDTVFIQGMYDAGAAPYFDLLGAHGAGYKVSPETAPEEVANNPLFNHNDSSPPELRRIYCFRHVEDIRKVMIANGDQDKRVALLEFGWTTDPRPDSPYYWHSVSEQEQAQYLTDAYQYAREHWQPWIAIMSLIYMPDSEWGIDDEQTYWSIIYPGYPELRMRAAYWVLQEMPKD